jgi:hypothetical protein
MKKLNSLFQLACFSVHGTVSPQVTDQHTRNQLKFLLRASTIHFYEKKYWKKLRSAGTGFLSVVLAMACLLCVSGVFGQTTVVYNDPAKNGTAANNFVVPAGISSVAVNAWGGGAGGRTSNNKGTAGGGGGAFASSVLPVTPNNTITVTVGAGGTGSSTSNNFGSSSSFGSLVVAAGAQGQTGGLASASTGQVRLNGGNGGDGGGNGNGSAGGGGGSSASASGNGFDGSAPSGSTGGAGGNGPDGDGGKGGNGTGTGISLNGGAGTAPGGGGGGRGDGGTSGAGANGQVSVTYFALPAISATSTVCSGGTATVTLTSTVANLPGGSYAVTYTLSTPNSGSSTAFMTVSAGKGTFVTNVLANSGPTTITITSISNGTLTTTYSGSNTVNVTVNTSPTAKIDILENSGVKSNDGIICTGDAATLTATGGTSYLWSPGGATDPTINVPSSSAGVTNFTVTVTAANGCSAITNQTVTVNASPTVGKGSPLSAICQGQTTVPLGGSFGGGATGAVWSDGGAGGTFTGNSGSAPENTTYTPNPSFTGTVTLTLTTTGGSCGEVSDSKTLLVNPTPVPTFNPVPEDVACVGTDVTYTTQSGQSSYVWTFTGNPGTDYSITSGGNSTSNSVTLKWLTKGSKTVTVKYANGSGCTATTAASYVTMVVVQPTFTAVVSSSATLCDNSSATITVSGLLANTEQTISYTIGGGATKTATVTTNAAGEATFSTVALTPANSGQTLEITKITHPDVTTGCVLVPASGNTATLPTVLGGSLTPPTIVKSPNLSAVCVGQTLTITSSGGSGGTGASPQNEYRYSTDNGASWSDWGADPPLPSFAAVSGTNLVEARRTDVGGSGCTVSASNIVSWTVNPIPVVPPIVAKETSGTSNDDGTICQGASVQLTASGGTSYSWSPGGSAPTSATTTVTPTSTSTYTVTVTASGCSATASKTITVNTLPVPTITTSVAGGEICSGTDLTYTTQSNHKNYVWSIGTSASDYVLTSGGDATSNTATLKWLVTNGNRTVSVKYTDENGCTASSSAISIAINPQPATPTILATETVNGSTITSDGIICGGETVTLTASSVTQNVSYSWSPGGTSPTQATTKVSPIATTNYTVVVTTGKGCTATDNYNITVKPTPTVFDLFAPGSQTTFCSNVSPITLTLSGSQLGYTYEFVPLNPSGNEAPGQQVNVPPTGGPLSIVLNPPKADWSYKMRASFNGCTVDMNNIIKSVGFASLSTPLATTTVVCTANPTASITASAQFAKDLKWQISTDNGVTWNFVSNSAPYSISTAADFSTSTLTVSGVTTSMNNQKFRVYLASAAPCGDNQSQPTTLSVITSPFISSPPVGASKCFQGKVTLNVAATVPGDVTLYTWYKDGTVVSSCPTCSTYTINSLSAADQGSYYVELSSQSPCTATSTPVTVSGFSSPTTTWTANYATDRVGWEFGDNWECGVPTAMTDVVIPVNIGQYPTIRSAITGFAKNLTIASQGATALAPAVTVQGTLQLFGNVTNNSVFDAKNGNIEFNGNTVTQDISSSDPAATYDVKNLKVGTNLLRLNTKLNLYGMLTFSGSNRTFQTNDGNLTMKSNATTTAMVTDVTNAGTVSGNQVTGNVWTERSISNVYTRRWRLVTAPVTGTNVNAAWQEGKTWGGGAPEAGTGYGTLITGGTNFSNAGAANTAGYDYLVPSVSPSIRAYQGSSSPTTNLDAFWVFAPSTKAAGFDSYNAYLLFIRGDRGITTGGGGTTLRAKGPLREQPSQYSLLVPIPAQQSFTLIGNPFASPIDFKSVYNDNKLKIQPYFWIWKSSLNTVGGYALVQPNGSGGYESIPYYLNYPGSATPGSSIISSGEGFFVVPATGSNTTIDIKQTHKTTANPLSPVLREQDIRPAKAAKLYVNVTTDMAGTKILVDGALAQYNNNAGMGASDIGKALNSGENLSINRDGRDLIVANRALLRKRDTVQLRFWNTRQRDYQFEIRSANFSAGGLSAFLLDKYLKKETPIDLGDAATSYAFTIGNDPAAKDPLRFMIVFGPGSPSPLLVDRLKAVEENGSVRVQWEVEDEMDIRRYELEKSANDRVYQKIGEVNASGVYGLQVYEQRDEHPSMVNYYRVKIIGLNGEVRYSSTVQVQLKAAKEKMALYPNPVKDNTLQLQFINKPLGTYIITLYDNSGKRLLIETFEHAGGSITKTLNINAVIASGIYSLEVKDGKGKKEVERVQILR